MLFAIFCRTSRRAALLEQCALQAVSEGWDAGQGSFGAGGSDRRIEGAVWLAARHAPCLGVAATRPEVWAGWAGVASNECLEALQTVQRSLSVCWTRAGPSRVRRREAAALPRSNKRGGALRSPLSPSGRPVICQQRALLLHLLQLLLPSPASPQSEPSPSPLSPPPRRASHETSRRASPCLQSAFGVTCAVLPSLLGPAHQTGICARRKPQPHLLSISIAATTLPRHHASSPRRPDSQNHTGRRPPPRPPRQPCMVARQLTSSLATAGCLAASPFDQPSW